MHYANHFKSLSDSDYFLSFFCSFLTNLTFDIILLSFWSIYGMYPVTEMHGDKWVIFPAHICSAITWYWNFSHIIWQIAKEEEKGVYLNFLNFLINDSIYLLDESLNKILELKEIEAEMANTVEWERRPAQEREERLRVFHQWENVSIVYQCS